MFRCATAAETERDGTENPEGITQVKTLRAITDITLTMADCVNATNFTGHAPGREGGVMAYWRECIEAAFGDAGIAATEEQISEVVSFVENAHENYGMAHGYDCIPNPIRLDNDRLKKELIAEREKVICKECGGKGYFMTYGGTFQSEHTCHKCNGEGRHSP